MKSHSVRDPPKIDRIAVKTIYPMTIYPGRSVVDFVKRNFLAVSTLFLEYLSACLVRISLALAQSSRMW